MLCRVRGVPLIITLTLTLALLLTPTTPTPMPTPTGVRVNVGVIVRPHARVLVRHLLTLKFASGVGVEALKQRKRQ